MPIAAISMSGLSAEQAWRRDGVEGGTSRAVGTKGATTFFEQELRAALKPARPASIRPAAQALSVATPWFDLR